MSATPAERRALLFLSAIACLGVGVRAAGAVRREPPRAEQRAALARQIDAVDSARAAGRSKQRGKARVEVAAGRRSASRPRASGASHRPSEGFGASRTPPATPQSPLSTRIDADVATAAELEALPRVGPALARRIVADRDSLGPFGSLHGLERVRGVGPALIRMLQDRVTFSGTPRLSNAVTTLTIEGRPPLTQVTPPRPSPTDERPRRRRRRRE